MASALIADLLANDFPTMKLQLRITKDQSDALLALRDGAARLMGPLSRAWASGAQEVVGRAVKNRFTGKGPFPVETNRLGVRTNRLRKSVRATALQVDGAGNASVSMGSNVSYFAAHEFGFRGQVQIKGHARRAVAEGRRGPRGKIAKKQIAATKDSLKRGRANFSYVRPHSRRVNIRARRPLGTELKSLQTRLTFFKKFNAVFARYLVKKS